MTSRVEIFLSNPTQEQLDLFKKDDLIQLARIFDLSEANASLTKQDIKKILVRYLVEKDILEQSALISVSKSASDSGIKLKELELKFKMELELKKLELQKEQMRIDREKEKEEEKRQIELQNEQMRIDREKEKEERGN